MATATEVVADVIHLRKTGPLSTYEGYISVNEIGTTYTNPIYQVPSDKYAEIILHIYADGSDGNAQLGSFCIGPLSSGNNNRFKYLRYQNDILIQNPIIGINTQGMSSSEEPGKGYNDGSGNNNNYYIKDTRFYAAPGDYIFRANAASSTADRTFWDMTIFLRNQP